jgi:plasmid stabilization system protein ParE
VTHSIRRRQGVDDDIAELALYLLSQSESVAIRFVDAVEITLKELARMPGMGSLKPFSNPSLVGVRSWSITGFPNHLIFYQAFDTGILVLAVLHGARDSEQILARRA